VLYRHTSLGRYAIAIGGNEEAATLTGIRVDRALAALAGIVITGRLNAIPATSATGLALHTCWRPHHHLDPPHPLQRRVA
jgi:ribose/xylose/arabinose/galactoside ABC-type transport system permease subunit